MKVTCVQKNIKTKLPTIELQNSPIGKINCAPEQILNRINEFKRNAVPVDGTSDEFIFNNKNKVIHSMMQFQNTVCKLGRNFCCTSIS